MSRGPPRLLRKDRHGRRHFNLSVAEGCRVAARFVIDARRTGDAVRRPVEHQIREQRIARKRLLDVSIAVAPGAELLNDPRREARRRIGLGKREGIGPRALDVAVARFDGLEGVTSRQRRLVLVTQLARRWGRHHEIEVDGDHVIGVGGGHLRGGDAAPIAALHAIASIAKPLGHQAIERRGDAADAPPAVRGLAAEAEPRERRDHDIKRVRGVAAVRRGVRQRPDQFEKLHDRTRPAVNKQQWKRVRPLAVEVDEVEVHAVHLTEELGVGVDCRLVGPPIVAVAPVVAESADVLEVGAVVPPGIVELAGPAGAFEPCLQVIEDWLGDVDAVRPNFHAVDDSALRDRGGYWPEAAFLAGPEFLTPGEAVPTINLRARRGPRAGRGSSVGRALH